MELNPGQHDAVHTLSGPLLVLAGAGTGKTRVVMRRLVELIRHGTRPSRILAVTFTNKAAKEMQERAEEMLGKRLDEKPEISTFHSLCVRILRRNIKHLGYPSEFAIYDRGDQESLARGALREVRIAETALKPSEAINFIGQWKTAAVAPAEAAAIAHSDKQHLAASVYRRYQDALRAAGAVDFDDLLLLTVELFERFPDVRRKEAARFDHLMIDEYQDTNQTQYRIVKALAAGHRNLCVVGDDDQSIYGWRGAEVTHILRFNRDWPDAKVVRLETNYRSTRQIIAWANRIIAFNKVRHAKQLRATKSGDNPRILQLQDENREALAVVGEIFNAVQSRRRRPGDFAILFRTNEQPRIFEEELRRAKLPYVLVGGTSFFDRKEIRDLAAYLRVIANPKDEISLLRAINAPARGIGQTTITRLTKTAVSRGIPIWDILPQADAVGKVTAAARRGIDGFQSMIRRYRKRAKDENLVKLFGELIGEIGYKEELARLYSNPDDLQSRWAAVEEMANALSTYVQREQKPTLAGFVYEISLGDRDDGKEKEEQLSRDAITLMTLHSAKGLEFPEVYLVGMEEGILPHKRSVADADSAVDEERRLCYVGITRAKERLYLLHAFRRSRYGDDDLNAPSRFLVDIPLRLVQGKEEGPRQSALRRATTWRPALTVTPSPPPAPPAAPQFAIGQRVHHPLFGEGTVIESKLTQDDEEVTVAFPDKGFKTLLASFAKLQKLGARDDS